MRHVVQNAECTAPGHGMAEINEYAVESLYWHFLKQALPCWLASCNFAKTVSFVFGVLKCLCRSAESWNIAVSSTRTTSRIHLKDFVEKHSAVFETDRHRSFRRGPFSRKHPVWPVLVVMSSRLVLRLAATLVLFGLTIVSCWRCLLQSVCSTAHSKSKEMPGKTTEDPVSSALRDAISTSDRDTSDCRRLFSKETPAYNFSMSQDFRSNVDEFLSAVNASTAGARDWKEARSRWRPSIDFCTTWRPGWRLWAPCVRQVGLSAQRTKRKSTVGPMP